MKASFYFEFSRLKILLRFDSYFTGYTGNNNSGNNISYTADYVLIKLPLQRRMRVYYTMDRGNDCVTTSNYASRDLTRPPPYKSLCLIN